MKKYQTGRAAFGDACFSDAEYGYHAVIAEYPGPI
jgi:hypothetical protein